MPLVRRIIGMTGQGKTVTIGPPPMIGGLVMKNINPFDILFTPPYGMFNDILSYCIDIIDSTIGVLKSDDNSLRSLRKLYMDTKRISQRWCFHTAIGYLQSMVEIMRRKKPVPAYLNTWGLFEDYSVYGSNCRLRPLSKPLYIRAGRQLNGFNTKSAIEKSLWVKLQAVIYLQGR